MRSPGGWVFVVLLAASTLLPACAGPPEAATEAASTATVTGREGIARLAAPFRDYRLHTTRPGGEDCAESVAGSGTLTYVESLEYTDAPTVTFGMDGDCIREIRTDYTMREGRFEHAISIASQRLGSPTGEDRAVCTATGDDIHAVFWDQPEGRFCVVRMGFETQPEFVLQPAGTPFTHARLCEGGVER